MERKISVIITVYNVEQYIDFCMESIVNQTYKNLDIILVDDGSTDRSSNKCEEWKTKDRRIRVIHKMNEGAVSARKAGVELAVGDYIGYVDGDDWIELDAYEKMADFGFKEDVDIISVEDIREYEDGRKQTECILFREGIYKNKEYKTSILTNIIDLEHFFQWNIPMHGWQHLYKRELAIRNQMMIDNRVKRGEDALSAFTCYMEAQSVALLKQPLYHYRQLPKSARSTITEKNLEGLVYLKNGYDNAYKKCINRQSVIKKEIIYCMIYNLLWAAYEICLTEDNDKLFPYEVQKNCRIVIIGAGVFGNRLYRRVKELNFCAVAAWVDSGWEHYCQKGLPVQSMDAISALNYDYVVIATLNVQTQNEIIKELQSRGVQKNRIVIIKSGIFTEETLDILMDRISRKCLEK